MRRQICSSSAPISPPMGPRSGGVPGIVTGVAAVVDRAEARRVGRAARGHDVAARIEIAPPHHRRRQLCSWHRRHADRFGQRLAGVVLAHDLIDLTEREPQRLAHVANRRARAVGDHFGHHRGVMAPVTLVDVLQHLLAVLMREVDVDVGDLVALFAQEALEEQVARDRVDRRDAERVAHRGVRRRTAPLSEHAQLARLVRDVPHHEEVAREIHARDDAELVLELPLDLRGERPAVALARAGVDQRAQIGVVARFAFGDRKDTETGRPASRAETCSAPRSRACSQWRADRRRTAAPFARAS